MNGLYVMFMDVIIQDFVTIGLKIDEYIYTFISYVYDLTREIAEIDIFSADSISFFSKSIYALIGIFMLFKLTFSMISYLVNPDEFSDKSKGFGGLIKNVIIALVLTVAVPYIFSEAYYVQRMILNDGTLEKMIFYRKTAEGEVERDDYSYIKDAGRDIQFTLFSQFVKPNDNILECREIYSYRNNKRAIAEGTKRTNVLNTECEAALDSIANSSDDANAGQTITYYKEAMKHRSFAILVNHPEIYTLTYTATSSDDDESSDTDNSAPVFKLNWLISTIVGVFVLLLLTTICMDIAVRAVKLGFYQLIAPIPIIASVAPGSKKDNVLQKWAKACFSTYIDLFIRLFGLYMTVFLIREINDNFKFEGLLSVAVIIGLLIFAKQLPKIINDITGLKFEGFTLNPFKKVANEAIMPESLKKPLGKISLAGAAGLAFGAGSTLAKKGIVGVDSKIHGKGFWNGANTVHGKVGNAVIKAGQTFTPMLADSMKQKAQGRTEVKQMHDKWTAGKRKADKLEGIARDSGKGNVFATLDGKNIDAYNAIYRNAEFKKSRMELDRMGEEQKALHRISESTMRGSSLKDAIAKELSSDVGGYLNHEKLKAIAAQNDMNAFIKMREDNDKTIVGKEKVHESLRKQNAVDADTEDQIKFVKYNSVDPTDSSRKYTGKIDNESSSQQQPQNNSSSSSDENNNQQNNGNNSSTEDQRRDYLKKWHDLFNSIQRKFINITKRIEVDAAARMQFENSGLRERWNHINDLPLSGMENLDEDFKKFCNSHNIGTE